MKYYILVLIILFIIVIYTGMEREQKRLVQNF